MFDPTADPVLSRFREAVAKLYGARLNRIVLYGSRVRGEARSDSDYDVAVFLHEMPDRWADMMTLADLSTDLLYETGELIHAMPYRAETYADARMPLMHEIRREGIDV